VGSAERTAPELAQALQHRYDSVKDFSADFVHTYQGGVLKKTITERGHVAVKKPGRMRWDYVAPEAKTFVSDGVKVYAYVPADKQVVVSSAAAADSASTPASFLAGRGSVVRDFLPSLVDLPPGLPAGSRGLKLQPRTKEADYDWLVVALDPQTLAIRGLATVDAQGGTSTFSFTNLQENLGLADRTFSFAIPRGVDVVNDAGHP
jgi:outer membrane lipoprotein carrier protein